MAQTRPTGDQLRFNSSSNGEQILDTYLEAAEKGGRTLADLLGDLFTDGGVVDFNAVRDFRGNWTTATLYRKGEVYADPVTKSLYLVLLDHTSAAAISTDVAASKSVLLVDTGTILTSAQASADAAASAAETAADDATAAVTASLTATVSDFADAAEASATAAAASETNAAASEAAAATSESNAATSETNAAASEAAAATSADDAATIAATLGSVGTNAAGARTVSTSDPSGGSDGDLWYKV